MERLSVTDAAATGSRLAALEATRAKLAAQIDATQSARDLPPLTRQLMQCLAEIEEERKVLAEQDVKSDLVDELRARREARRLGKRVGG